jgi:hypothetical protein
MGGKVIELYVGRERRMYKAQLELATGHPKSPESIIRGLCKLIQELPSDARRLWDAAKSREFDIGIEAPELIGYYWCSLGPTVIKASSDIKAFVTITIYGPMKTVGKPGKSASSVEKTPA